MTETRETGENGFGEQEGKPRIPKTEKEKVQFQLAEAKESGQISEDEIRELESLELQTSQLNPEAFEKNVQETEIQDIASNSNYTFVVREINGLPQVQIYSEVGLVVPPERVPFSNITCEDVISLIEKRRGSYDYVYWKENYAPRLQDRIQQTVGHSLDAQQIKEAVENFVQKLGFSSTTYFSVDQARTQVNRLKANSESILPKKPLKVKTSPSGEKFILTYGEETVIYTARKEDKNLSPGEWEKRVYPNKDDFRNKTAKETPDPELDEYFIYEDKSRIIPEAGVVATFSEKEILTFVDKDNRTNYFRAGARDFDLDPSDKKTVYFIKAEGNNTLCAVDSSQTKGKKWKIRECEATSITGKILEMKLDPRGNFITVIYEEESEQGKEKKVSQRKLAILEKDTLEKVKEYDNVNGHLEIDPTGTIYYEDSNHQLRAITTNFLTFPEGGIEAIKQKRLEHLKTLQEKIGGLTIEEIRTKKPRRAAKTTEITEDVLKEQMRNKVADIFDKELKGVKNLEQLAEVQEKVNAIKSDPDFVKYPEVFLDVETQVSKRINEIKTDSLETLLEQFKEKAKTIKDPEGALSLDNDLQELLRIRQAVSIADLAKRREIDESIQKLEKSAGSIIAKHQEELVAQTEEKMGEITELIKNVSSQEELKDVLLLPQVVAFEKQITQIRDRASQKDIKDRFKSAVSSQRTTIEAKQKTQAEKERQKNAELIEESKELLGDISKMIDEEVKDSKELDQWTRKNPYLTKYTTLIIGLPTDLRRDAENRLETLLSQKRGDLEYKKTFKAPGDGEEVKFGKEKFPVFKDIPTVWKPEIVPLSSESKFGNLIFKDNQGRTFVPKIGNLPIDPNDPTTQEVIGMFTEKAENYFASLKREIPHFDERWSLNDFYEGKLEEMTKLLKIQLDHKEGILILEGEAGTGKNVLFDMFAHFTNREVFMFSCNMQSEKEDITYAFRYDPTKGTYQIESKVLEALKTPGAILIFDEINTLPKGVSKMLNPLLDYRRTLFFPEHDKKPLKADPSVLIAGTENPQYYLGTSPLAPEVKSRARIMKVPYPPEGRMSGYKPYESMIYAKHVDSLKTLKTDEFEKLWDFVINNKTDNGGDKYLIEDRKEDINKLKIIVGVANAIRSAYEAFRTGKSTEIFEFVFSLREGTAIAQEMADTKDVKKAIKNVVLPKVSDPAENERVETIIDNY